MTLVGGNVTLRCIVQGTPQPRYEWVLGQGFVGFFWILVYLSLLYKRLVDSHRASSFMYKRIPHKIKTNPYPLEFFFLE